MSMGARLVSAALFGLHLGVQRAVQIGDLVGELLAGVAHELNNSLVRALAATERALSAG